MSATDPRRSADNSYAAFMSMPEPEWQGLLRSILGGGVLEVEENVGFERALRDRKPSPQCQDVPVFTVIKATYTWTGKLVRRTGHAWTEGAEHTLCGVEAGRQITKSAQPSFDCSSPIACKRCVAKVRKAHPEVRDHQRLTAQTIRQEKVR